MSGKEKRVHFSGLDKPFPFPIATPPESRPSNPSLRLSAKHKTGAMCNEMTAVVRLGRQRPRRRGLFKEKGHGQAEDDSETNSSQGGTLPSCCDADLSCDGQLGAQRPEPIFAIFAAGSGGDSSTEPDTPFFTEPLETEVEVLVKWTVPVIGVSDK